MQLDPSGALVGRRLESQSEGQAGGGGDDEKGEVVVISLLLSRGRGEGYPLSGGG